MKTALIVILLCLLAWFAYDDSSNRIALDQARQAIGQAQAAMAERDQLKQQLASQPEWFKQRLGERPDALDTH